MNRLLITIACGEEYSRLLTLTEPFFRAYADKCGAMFFPIEGSVHQKWSMEEKFRVHTYARYFGQTLYVDADCWIKPECPDLFEMGGTALHDDKLYIQNRGFWDLAEYNSVMRSQHQPEVTDLPRMLGAGVVLCEKETAWIWKRPRYALPDTHCAEQCWVGHQAEKAGASSLASVFNWQSWFRDFRDGLDDAFIVHLASEPNRYEVMKNLINGSY